jgi:hypothetical protein
MDALDAQSLWVPAIRPPTVPVGTSRLRICLSAAHSEAEVARLCAALRHAAELRGAGPCSDAAHGGGELATPMTSGSQRGGELRTSRPRREAG